MTNAAILIGWLEMAEIVLNIIMEMADIENNIKFALTFSLGDDRYCLEIILPLNSPKLIEEDDVYNSFWVNFGDGRF